jgi:hypothetical protein
MYWLDLIGGFELPAEKMPKFGIILPGSARGNPPTISEVSRHGMNQHLHKKLTEGRKS